MAIHYTHEQYEQLRHTYRQWWNGDLDRPIVPIITYGHPSEITPVGPWLRFANAWDTTIDPREFVNAYDTGMDSHRWHGEGYPLFRTDAFGPGVLAAFLGATPVGTPHTVWFQPPRKDIPIEELHFEWDDANPCYRRVANLFEAAMEKWHGRVVIGMTDLGSALDVLQTFRGAENLLMDLYDSPDEVLRCSREIREMWMLAFDKLTAIMEGEAEGYSHWYAIYHERPGYIVQSDFSYMIGPDMFKTFTAPELASLASHLDKVVYHMDGIGQIPHLDTLLSMDYIRGIQWVPGEGEPCTRNWDELMAKILASGKKLIHRTQKPDGSPLDIAADRPGQLYFEPRSFHVDQMDAARRYGGMYGISVD